MRDTQRNKIAEMSLISSSGPQLFLSAARPVPRTEKRRGRAMSTPAKVLGKLCPRCGAAGAVFCETRARIIYECRNGHQYESKKRQADAVL